MSPDISFSFSGNEYECALSKIHPPTIFYKLGIIPTVFRSPYEDRVLHDKERNTLTIMDIEISSMPEVVDALHHMTKMGKWKTFENILYFIPGMERDYAYIMVGDSRRMAKNPYKAYVENYTAVQSFDNFFRSIDLKDEDGGVKFFLSLPTCRGGRSGRIRILHNISVSADIVISEIKDSELLHITKITFSKGFYRIKLCNSVRGYELLREIILGINRYIAKVAYSASLYKTALECKCQKSM